MSKTASFVIRPYDVPVEFEEALPPFSLQVSESEDIHVSESRKFTSIIVNQEDQAQFNVQLSGSINQESLVTACAQMGCKPSDVSLIVLCQCNRLMLADLVYSRPVDEVEDHFQVNLSGTCTWLDGVLGSAGVSVEALLVLNKSLPPRDFFPVEKGFWLGRQGVRFSSESQAFEFDPAALTPDVAEQEKIPVDTLVYVTYTELFKEKWSGLHTETDAKNTVIVYTNDSLTQNMVVASRQARQMSVLLMVQEVFQQLVALIHEETQKSDGLPTFVEMKEKQSIAYLVCENIADAIGVTKPAEVIYNLIRDEPHRAMAYCYAATESSRLLKEYMREAG